MTFRTDGDDPTLTDFLRQLGLPQLESAFASEDIDLHVLARLNESDLKELGLSLGHRVRLLEAIQELKADTKPGAPDTPDPRPVKTIDKTPAGKTSRFTVGCPAKPEYGLAQSSKPEAVQRRKQAYENRDIEALVEFLQGNIFTEPGTDQLKNRTIELRKQLPADTILSFFDPAPDVDVSGILNSINIPVLVTHGGKDRQVSIESSNLIARTIPQAKLHIFENSGHIPMVTAAQEFCAVVEKFIGTTNIE